MKQNFLKIPINRILALILLDIMSIVVASFAALYIRFDFSFEGIPQEYLIKFENIYKHTCNIPAGPTYTHATGLISKSYLRPYTSRSCYGM